jgi:hypothetical protein
VEVTDAPHNRRDGYDDKESAEIIARILNMMVEQYDDVEYDDRSMSAIDAATVDGFVDGFDVVLREDAVEVTHE